MATRYPRDGGDDPRRPVRPAARRPTRAQRRRTTRRRVTARRARNAGEGARSRLKNFRQASIVAVAVTGFLLMLIAPEEVGLAQQQVQDTVVVEQTTDTADTTGEVAAVRADTLVRATGNEARRTVRNLWNAWLGALPKVIITIGTLLLAWILVRIIRPIVRLAVGRWERGTAITAIVGIAIWLIAIGVAVSVLAGDIRALLGSFGLVGLALSWALQTPIESFTGWLMNSFQGYYRVGDRVAVGEVFGDVYRIDFLTTTVWEAGSIGRAGFVHAEQPTGRLITFPNSEVLSGSIVNLTRDFPWVWDELAVPVANGSDLGYAAATLLRVTSGIVGDYMRAPAAEYERILRSSGLESEVAREPQIFISLDESWTTLTVRYLVGARERRLWKSRLATAVMEEMNRPEHAGRIQSAYPRRQIQFLDAGEMPIDVEGLSRAVGGDA